MSTYSDYQNQNVSEKIILARIEAANRLIGFELHSGTIYRLVSFDFSSIVSIEDTGSGMTEVSGLSEVVPGSFFNDRANKILYVETSDSANPNGKYLAMVFANFFSNVPIQGPENITSGNDVNWLPMIESVSGFGVQLDNDDQIGFALEGSGSISFTMDRSYFDEHYEGYLWENQDVSIYSIGRNLPFSEAKIVFRGVVNAKQFSSGIRFTLKDQIKRLRQYFPLDTLEEISGALVPEGLLMAKKRRIYGRPNGFRPTNIDQVLDGGYTLTGTVSVTAASAVVTGSGTSFLTWFSPDDNLILNGEEYAVSSVASDTSMTLTEAVEFTASGLSFSITPAQPKNFINRDWCVAGHACSQVETTVTNADSQNIVYLDAFNDLYEGDELYFGSAGSRERSFVSRVFTNGRVELTENLVSPPTVGTEVIRPCVQNLRINNRRLLFDRDFTISIASDLTTLTLDSDAEKNIAPIRSVNGTVSFTNTLRSVTGSGTNFTSQLLPGQHIRAVGQVQFFQILSIESDTALTLVEASNYTENTSAQYKAGTNFNTEEDILSCTVIGSTVNNLKSGDLLIRPGEVVKDVLTQSGITNLNSASFSLADDRAPHDLGLVIPKTFDSTTSEVVRDIINDINISVFGSLVQNEDFELEYNILQPNRPESALKLMEADVLDLTVTTDNDRIVRTASVEYDIQEYSPLTEKSMLSIATKTSDVGQYLTKTDEEKLVRTYLINEWSAQIMANRWAFLLEIATNVIKIKTKLKAARLQVNDVVYLEHEKLFERLGGGKRRFGAVQSIKKKEGEVEIQLDDLANAFNRVCVISPNSTNDYDNATEEERLIWGYITDQYGLINNGKFGFNLIW